MINLYINTDDKKLIEFVYEACEMLGINDSKYELFIDFDNDEEDDIEAYTTGDEETAEITMYVNDMLVLSHELIHAKQYLLGELQDGGIFKGQKYVDVDYHDKPWEVEAYLKESEIYKLYK